MKEIKVSVVIPVYNVEKYLHECMDSVINQTLKEIEIICVDDGSTDSSLSILQEYAKNDDRITVLQQENQGAGTARNAGLDIAKGEYLSFLDPDDFFELTMLEETYNKAVDTDVDIVVYSANYYNTVTKIFELRNYPFNPNNLPKKTIFSYKDMSEKIFQSFGYCAWNKLYKSSFVKNNNLRFQLLFRANDGLFTYISIILANSITTINKVFVHYRKGALTNSQATLNQYPLNFTLAETAIFDKLNQLCIYEEVKSSFLKSLLVSTVHNLKSQKTYNEFVEVYNYIQNTYENKFEITKNSNLFKGDKHHTNFLNEYYDIVRNSLDDYILIKGVYLEPNDNVVRVSVIIPVFNAEKYLFDCLNSVVTQNFTNIEIICIDDGSNDNSFSILQEYSKQDIRIIVLEQSNQGAGVARNLGISKAKGEYITFLDSDDIMEKDAIFSLLKCAVKNKSDVVISAAYMFKFNINNRFSYNSSLRKNFMPIGQTFSIKNHSHFLFQITNGVPWGKLYRNEFVKDNNLYFPNVPKSEDFFFVYNAYVVAKKIAVLDKKTVNYRIEQGNLSLEDSRDKFMDTKSIVKRMLYDRLNDLGIYDKVEQTFLNTIINGNYSDLILYKTSNAIEINYKLFKEEVEFYNIDMEDMSYFYNKEAYLYMKKLYDSESCIHFLFERNKELIKHNDLAKGIRKDSFKNKPNNKINGQLRWARSELKKVRSERLEYKKELTRVQGIKSSLTYQIGSFFTFIPRSIRNLFKKNSNVVYKNIPNKDYYYYKSLSPEYYEAELKEWYQKRTGETLDLKNPKTFNEKLQWLKLYDSTPLKTRLADKYLVRDWIKEKIGEEYLIPLLGVWDSFDEIDFDKLPNQFALKTNHSSGWNYIVKDKSIFNAEDARKKFNIWLNKNYAFVFGLELHYLNIKPKIIAEKYIENANDLYDYKFMCFGGEIGLIWVDSNRYNGHKRNYYDLNWSKINVSIGEYTNTNFEIEKPINFNKMVEFSEKLSNRFDCVRVDFYEIDDRLYFGELTFTSGSGVSKFEPASFGYELGDRIKLSKKSKIPRLKK